MIATAAVAGFAHAPVLAAEVLEALSPRDHGVYVDGTLGGAGHASQLRALAPGARLIGIDRDPSALDASRLVLSGVSSAVDGAVDGQVDVVHGTYADLPRILGELGIAAVDGILLDLGVSSPQLDEAARGFSFMADAPLDMRMDTTQGESAADFLAHASEKEIADVLWNYGDERFSRKIARAIVEDRVDNPITRTGQLAALIERLIGRREPGKHPATRSFQALRIHVNGELEALEHGLNAALELLKVGGRLSIISFHSLEDRAVKLFIRDHSGRVQGSRRGPPVAAAPARLAAVGKAQFPSEAELSVNPRARSAVLRVAEKLA